MTIASIRAVYRNLHGRHKISFDWDAINKDKAVVITACEYGFPRYNVGGGGRETGDAPEVEPGKIGENPVEPYDPNREERIAREAAEESYRRTLESYRNEARAHLGNASIWVTNITPRGGQVSDGLRKNGVDFYLHIDHPSGLDVLVTYSVLSDVKLEYVA